MRRRVARALVLAALLTVVGGAQGQERLPLSPGFGEGAPSARDYARLLQEVQKPRPASGVSVSRPGGDDSCQHANDLECDEPGFGTGACAAGTDHSDCWRLMAGVEDDSCKWANDGECDETGIGTGACTQGTDATDCGVMIEMRFQTDQCDSAFNGVCEDREAEAGAQSAGICEARSDRADCFTRERPMTIQNHFRGRDDRILPDTAKFPWSIIGQVSFDQGGSCTATLVRPAIVVTAAHCIADGPQVLAAGDFTTGADLPGGARSARIVDYLIADNWDAERFAQTIEIDSADWALLRLDTPLGAELGFLNAAPAADSDHLRALKIGAVALVLIFALLMAVSSGIGRVVWGVLMLGAGGAGAALVWLPLASANLAQLPMAQAGYSWDTGDNLSGDMDCQILQVHPDGTIEHDCDTTQGDSGSPIMARQQTEAGEAFTILAVDSNFREFEDNSPAINIAANASGWVDLIDPFAAGEIGNGGLLKPGPGKPGTLEPIKATRPDDTQ